MQIGASLRFCTKHAFLQYGRSSLLVKSANNSVAKIISNFYDMVVMIKLVFVNRCLLRFLRVRKRYTECNDYSFHLFKTMSKKIIVCL